ncbi:hypothetical protein ACH4PU_36155 [Streptomyces sp. NPDC021100]|uniref:hypothetical protein n=1 Tax=Streptomyces sp. NPDC021100 TaxID=3365114 RepID=UPI003795D480
MAGLEAGGLLDVGDFLVVVGGADAGDRHAGRVGEVGELVGTGTGELASVRDEPADLGFGGFAAVAGGGDCRQQRLVRLRVGVGCGFEVEDGLLTVAVGVVSDVVEDFLGDVAELGHRVEDRGNVFVHAHGVQFAMSATDFTD